MFLLLDHLLPLLTTAKAAHGDLECGHCGTSRRRHIIAAAGRPASRRPLRDRVRNGVKKKEKNSTSILFEPLGRNCEKMRSQSDFLCLLARSLAGRQPAGGERHPGEVHLRPAGGGHLEPRLHGHAGTPRLRQGETPQQ